MATNTKGKQQATNFKEIERVMGSTYCEGALLPASTSQLYFLGSLFGQVWLKGAGVDVDTFKYQARKIFGAIVCKANDNAKYGITRFDVALAKENFDKGNLKVPAAMLKACTVDPTSFKPKAPKTARKVKAKPTATPKTPAKPTATAKPKPTAKPKAKPAATKTPAKPSTDIQALLDVIEAQQAQISALMQALKG